MTIDNDSLKISEDLISTVQSITKSLRYPTSSNLFYQGQTPIVAYMVTEGLVHFIEKGEVIRTFDRGNVLGVKELMSNKVLHVAAQAQPGTELCFIDRSTIIKIMSEEDSGPLKAMIKRLIDTDSDVRQSISI